MLLRELAGADGGTDAREWSSIRSYLRFFWADEPVLAEAADPGPSPLPPPSRSELQQAAETVRRSIGEEDERLLLQMLYGVAEQTGGISETERARLRAVAEQCRIPVDRVDELLGARSSAAPPPQPPPADDPWTVIGLPRGSEPAAIRRRYLELVRENHPDRHAHLGPAFEAAATRRMVEINQAYRRLTRRR